MSDELIEMPQTEDIVVVQPMTCEHNTFSKFKIKYSLNEDINESNLSVSDIEQ